MQSQHCEWHGSFTLIGEKETRQCSNMTNITLIHIPYPLQLQKCGSANGSLSIAFFSSCALKISPFHAGNPRAYMGKGLVRSLWEQPRIQLWGIWCSLNAFLVVACVAQRKKSAILTDVGGSDPQAKRNFLSVKVAKLSQESMKHSCSSARSYK